MNHATLAASLPEDTWIGELSRRFPEARFRVLSALPGGDAGFGIVRITDAHPSPIVEETVGHSGLAEAKPLYSGDDRAIVQFETRRRPLLLSARTIGLPLEIRDGEARFEATGTEEQLSELCARLRGFGLEVRVVEVGPALDPARTLSDIQRDLVVEAVERGYYDTPRECTLTELAEAVGIAKSTCSETLHRAEEAIVKGFVSDLPAATDLE